MYSTLVNVRLLTRNTGWKKYKCYPQERDHDLLCKSCSGYSNGGVELGPTQLEETLWSSEMVGRKQVWQDYTQYVYLLMDETMGVVDSVASVVMQGR